MNSIPRILIVDDDETILTLLGDFLSKHNYYVEIAINTKLADALLTKNKFDIMVLDIMMPHEDGLSYCKRLRNTSAIPIIMLTAVGEDTDRIIGLELGADDYLTKPFNPRELLARIRAVLRRQNGCTVETLGTALPVVNCFKFKGWKLDPLKRELINPENTMILLTAAEFDLLICFVDHPNEVLSREYLLDLTKGWTSAGPYDRSIDVLLSRLRHKIEEDSKNPSVIKTIRNKGYILTADVERIVCD